MHLTEIISNFVNKHSIPPKKYPHIGPIHLTQHLLLFFRAELVLSTCSSRQTEGEVITHY